MLRIQMSEQFPAGDIGGLGNAIGTDKITHDPPAILLRQFKTRHPNQQPRKTALILFARHRAEQIIILQPIADSREWRWNQRLTLSAKIVTLGFDPGRHCGQPCLLIAIMAGHAPVPMQQKFPPCELGRGGQIGIQCCQPGPDLNALDFIQAESGKSQCGIVCRLRFLSQATVSLITFHVGQWTKSACFRCFKPRNSMTTGAVRVCDQVATADDGGCI